MFSRQCIKISSNSRSYIKFINKRVTVQSVLCDCNKIQHYRFSSDSIKCTEYSNNTNISGPPKFSKYFIKGRTKSSVSCEELLEKMIAGLSTDIHQKKRVYKNDLLRILNKIKELNFSTVKQGLLLIQCCTELLPDETPASRMDLVEQVWNTLRPHTKFVLEHYHELLRVYIANKRTLTVASFIQQMGNIKPTVTTYELILRALAEVGDLNQATEVISNMKAQGLPATEDVFSSLIVCQGKCGNLNSIQEVLIMMKSLKIEYSVDTCTATVRAYALNKKKDLVLNEMEKAKDNKIVFEELHIMEIIKTLASMEMYDTITSVLKFLPQDVLKTPSISPYMQKIATLLVFQNHPIVALEIYKCLPLPSFGPKDDKGLHGRSLIRDCVKASMPSSVISLIAQQLMSSGRNPIAIHNACEAALQLGKVPLAMDLFTKMKQLGMPLRPHYFWPILLHMSKCYGEKGIMNTLSTMVSMEVKPDYETIMTYTLPYVSFTSPQNLMKKFQETGLNVTTVLTPMMETLLNTGQVRAASEICELFDGKVDAEILLKPLVKGYLISFDVISTIHLLEDMTKKAVNKNKDWVGRFLCVFMRLNKSKEDLNDFLNIIEAFKEKSIKISSAAADFCTARLPEKCDQKVIDSVKDTLIEITDETLVDDSDIFNQQIPHPKQMNEESLRAHLNELDAKNMNTRGVLRKLLQQYCREGNLIAAQQIVDRCQNEGIFLSAGMKATMFDLHVKLGELDLAELTLMDLNKSSPNFTLDEFKIVDFATLMVLRRKFDQAFELINEQSKKRRIIGGRNISMNCWRLLDAMCSQASPKDTQRMFELLIMLRYCKPTNTILGPLIRVHLNINNLQAAVQEFARLAKKYNKTPLKHELLCKILLAMGDGGSEETFIINEQANSSLSKLVQSVLNVDKKVHGAGDVQLSLIAALAEVGYRKTLRKLLLDPTAKFHPDALLRRCERFADEKKVSALQTIAECAKNLRHVDMEEIYNLMLDVYQRNDNCQDALSLWYKMQENDITPSQKFIRNLGSLCTANNKEIPSDLAVLLDKQNRKASN